MKVATFSERLREGLEKAKLKPADLSRLTGISKSSLSHYLKGDWEGKQDAVYKIARALNVSEPWLMGMDAPMERADNIYSSSTVKYPTPETTEDIVTFPVIGEIAAGYDHIAYEDWSGDTVDIPLSYLKGRPREDYLVLRVIGSSMFPMYQDGDTVLVLKQSTLNRSGEIGAVLYDDYATLKKVEYVNGEDWMRLIPINPTFEPQLIEGADLERCRILGIPKYLIREID